MDTPEREPQPLEGTLPPEPGPIRSYRWEWGREEDRQPKLPWIGIFLVVLGALLLFERTLPEYQSLGNVAVLAAGIAFLLLWALRRGTFALYAGAFLTAASVPGLLAGVGYPPGDGFAALCFGIAFLFVASVRMSRGGGVGWQALVGVLLVTLGASEMALPDLASLVFPALLVVLGLILLTRGRG